MQFGIVRAVCFFGSAFSLFCKIIDTHVNSYKSERIRKSLKIYVGAVSWCRSLNKQLRVLFFFVNAGIKSDFIQAGGRTLPSHSGYNAIRMYMVLMLFLLWLLMFYRGDILLLVCYVHFFPIENSYFLYAWNLRKFAIHIVSYWALILYM